MRRMLLPSAIALVAGLASVANAASTFTTGDVMASTNAGRYEQWRNVSGTWTLIDTLSNGSGGFTTGSAFDSAGNFYGTNFSTGDLSKFSGPGTPHTLTTLSGGLGAPEAIVFSATGDMYTDSVSGFGIKKIDKTTGATLATYAAGIRVDWMDLAADGHTMYYTQEGGAIHRWDLATNTALSDFCTVAGDYALRILADGSVLVANNEDVKHISAAGAIIASYDVAGVDGFFALNLNPDGTSFWTGSFQNDQLYKFDIASGALLDSFSTGHGGSNLYGVSVFGEITIATNSVPLPRSAWLGLTMLVGLGALSLRRRKNELI